MKYNVRDPKTGRFVKQIATNVSSSAKTSTPRDPITGRFVSMNAKQCSDSGSSTTFKTTTVPEQNVPDWKIEFDKQMSEFHAQMAKFDEAMEIFHSTISED